MKHEPGLSRYQAQYDDFRVSVVVGEFAYSALKPGHSDLYHPLKDYETVEVSILNSVHRFSLPSDVGLDPRYDELFGMSREDPIAQYLPVEYLLEAFPDIEERMRHVGGLPNSKDLENLINLLKD